MEKFEIDLLVIKDAIEKKKLEEENQRPFLQLEIEDYPELLENKQQKPIGIELVKFFKKK